MSAHTHHAKPKTPAELEAAFAKYLRLRREGYGREVAAKRANVARSTLCKYKVTL